MRWLAERAFEIQWRLGDESLLTLLANLSDSVVAGVALPTARKLYSLLSERQAADVLAPWAVAWFLEEPA